MVGRKLRADVEEIVLGHAKFGDDCFRLNLGLAEVAALRLGKILGLGDTGAKLNGGIAVPICFAAGNDL